MKNVKKIFKIVAFLFIFGFAVTLLINYGLNVNAAESKYIEIVTGTGKDLGDEVRIGNEHFFILSNNGNEIKMLAKYNVDISALCTYNYDVGRDDYEEDSATGGLDKIDDGQPGYLPMCGVRKNFTGLQDASITGVPDDKTGDVIGVPFSTEDRQGKTPLSYEGSVAEVYVNEYVSNLNHTYNIDVTGDLLDNAMFTKLFHGVDRNNVPSDIKKMITVTSWTKVQADNQKLIILDAVDQKYYSYEYNTFFSIRPVITAPASALNEKEVDATCEGLLCFKDSDEDGHVTLYDEICIREECFYVLSTENNQVKMLAKYNLDAGLSCLESAHAGSVQSSLNDLQCELISNTDVKQNINARGFIAAGDGTVTSYGGVVYNQAPSLVTQYVNYINSLVDVEFSGSLITIEDIEAATENFSSFSIENNAEPRTSSSMYEILNREITGMSNYYYLFQIKSVPDWIYANSYWTGSAKGDARYAVTSDGYLADFPGETTGEFGVRPLLTLSLNDVPTPGKDRGACYICGNELVWTDSADESSCILYSDITDANMCIDNPKTGVKKHTILMMCVISIAFIVIGLISKHNRFKKI